MQSLRNDLIDLIEHGVIEDKHIDKAIELSSIRPSGKDWAMFFSNLFVWVGSLSFGLSVIFFFAYNWEEMGSMTKFAIVEVCLIVSIFTYIKARSESMLSKAAVLLSCLIVGALLALFGQTYQTGADTWQLFAVWALLISPWVLVARFVPIWALWLVLINLAISLYLDTHPSLAFFVFSSTDKALLSLFIFNSLILIVWEALSQSRDWMKQRWMARLLATAAGTCITSLVGWSIFQQTVAWPLALWGGFIVAIYYGYRKRNFDLFMLTGSALSVIVVALFFVMERLEGVDELLYLLSLAMLILTLGLIAALWLKKIQEEEV